MPLNNLKILKQKIDSNLIFLKQYCPYALNLSKSLDNFMKNNPTDEKAVIWIEGCIEMIVHIEKYLYLIKNGNECSSKSRLEFLKVYINKYRDELYKKFPLINTVRISIETLLCNSEFTPLIKPWIKGLENYLGEIEKEIFYREYLK